MKYKNSSKRKNQMPFITEILKMLFDWFIFHQRLAMYLHLCLIIIGNGVKFLYLSSVVSGIFRLYSGMHIVIKRFVSLICDLSVIRTNFIDKNDQECLCFLLSI